MRIGKRAIDHREWKSEATARYSPGGGTCTRTGLRAARLRSWSIVLYTLSNVLRPGRVQPGCARRSHAVHKEHRFHAQRSQGHALAGCSRRGVVHDEFWQFPGLGRLHEGATGSGRGVPVHGGADAEHLQHRVGDVRVDDGDRGASPGQVRSPARGAGRRPDPGRGLRGGGTLRAIVPVAGTLHRDLRGHWRGHGLCLPDRGLRAVVSRHERYHDWRGHRGDRRGVLLVSADGGPVVAPGAASGRQRDVYHLRRTVLGDGGDRRAAAIRAAGGMAPRGLGSRVGDGRAAAAGGGSHAIGNDSHASVSGSSGWPSCWARDAA